MGEKGRTIVVTLIFSIFLMLAILSPICQSANEGEQTTGFPAGWSDDIRLTSSPYQDDYLAVANCGDNVYITWQRPDFFTHNIYFRSSNDNGLSWGTEMRLTNNISGIHCTNPDIGVSDDNIHIVWHDNDAIASEMKYVNSSDGGLTWSTPKMISEDDGWNSQYAKIVVNGSVIHVVWVDGRYFVRPDFNDELYYVRSVDGGTTWDDGLGNIGQERRLTNAIWQSQMPNMAVEGNAIHLVWGDARDGGGAIYYKRSLDNGATWDDGLGNINQDRKLTNNLTFSHGLPTVAVNGSTIHVAWVDAAGSFS
jgi:hypothetical protein